LFLDMGQDLYSAIARYKRVGSTKVFLCGKEEQS